MNSAVHSPKAAHSEQALLDEFLDLGDLDEVIPTLARDTRAMRRIETFVRNMETSHELIHGDARAASALDENSIHLALTSPPYWTLKRYNEHAGRMGHLQDYDQFMAGLDQVWSNCYKALVPGGRLVINVGDVCLSRRKNNGRHTVVPLHATIQERCKTMGFDNLATIIWHKIANAKYEVSGGGGFLGKPYEPNAVIKNDIEFVLMQRKPGGYRSPTKRERLLSIISPELSTLVSPDLVRPSRHLASKASRPVSAGIRRAIDPHVFLRRRHRPRSLHGHRHDESRMCALGTEQRRH